MVQLLFVDLRQVNHLQRLAGDPVMAPYLPELSQTAQARIDHIFSANKKGRLLSRALDRLPAVRPTTTDTDRARIRVGRAADLDADRLAALRESLAVMKPWRKGPFDIFGLAVDGEWDSSIKWGRLAAHLGALAGKRVLDIGSSSGYYMFRMASRQPRWILGLEPYLNYYFQFLALTRYIGAPQIHCLPLKLEELPAMRRCFDVVLCMGILYHRRSPLDTLLKIHGMMPPGGQLVLETLILEGSGEMALCPRNRYAKMKNIYFIPTLSVLTGWLARTGFDRIRCVDVSLTTSAEQRQTDWIDTESLADFLDPETHRQTVEGYPAPVRAMVLANTRT